MIQPTNERPPEKKSTLSTEALGRFRELLLEERIKSRKSLLRLHSDAIEGNPENVGDMPARTHLADLGSDTFEQEENLGLAEQFSRVLTAIDRALDSLERGTYGICEACESPIPPERLEAIPYATRCAACQSQLEQGLEEEG
jgi:RNA polymerase-binding transcription factor DksA